MGDALKTTTDVTAGYAAQNGRDLNGERSNAFYGMLTNPGSSMNVSDLYGKAQDQYGRSASDLMGELGGAQGSMMSQAQQVASAATSPYGQNANALAAQQANETRRSLEQRLGASGLGNFGSGAALSSIAQGASEPYAQALTNISQLYSNAYQNAYSPMQQSALSSISNRGNQYASLGNSLLGQLGSQSEQALLSPNFQTSAFGSLMGNALGSVGGQLGGMLSSGIGNIASSLFGGSSLGSISGGASDSYNKYFGGY